MKGGLAMKKIFRLKLVLVLLLLSFGLCYGKGVDSKGHKEILMGTVPLNLEDNRVFVDLTFLGPNGSLRKARAWVDTGGGWFAMTEALAKELNLSVTGKEITTNDGEHAVPVVPPNVFVGALPLDLSSAHTYSVLGVTRIDPGINAEVFLPARVLMHYDVVFDYPARRFTIAKSTVLKHRSEGVPSPIQPDSGFPRVELSIDNKSYGFLLDTGAAYTMVSRELLESLAAQHPGWDRLTGAVGEANMIGSEMDTDALLLRLPQVGLGSLQLHSIGTVSRRVGIFETSMSRMMTAPIVGAIAGNMLKMLRVEIDYPNGKTYFESGRKPAADGLDNVGIVIQTMKDGSCRITGVARRGEKPVLSGIEKGDQLLRIDKLVATGATRAAVIRSLNGRPGDKRRLQILRNGKQLDLIASVQHLL
jgi:predicted aspartyl protease